MAVTATVPILPGAAVNQERSYASYPQSRRRGSSGTVVATRLSTSGLSRETLLSHAPKARLTVVVRACAFHAASLPYVVRLQQTCSDQSTSDSHLDHLSGTPYDRRR